jgi:hypothetical protein
MVLKMNIPLAALFLTLSPTASHLRRNAYLYLRQSTMRQVLENNYPTITPQNPHHTSRKIVCFRSIRTPYASPSRQR